ncbi:MAG: hypothetical protein OXI66_05975 [Boseongicola sp.]|nr:hypothetical protein [Boseongicola sp.]
MPIDDSGLDQPHQVLTNLADAMWRKAEAVPQWVVAALVRTMSPHPR